MEKPLLQSSVSPDPSEIILYADLVHDNFFCIIIINVENSCAV